MKENNRIKDEALEQITGGYHPIDAYVFEAGDAFDYRGDLFVYDGPDGKAYSADDDVPMKLYFPTDVPRQFKLQEIGGFSGSFIFSSTKPLGKISTLGYDLIG